MTGAGKLYQPTLIDGNIVALVTRIVALFVGLNMSIQMSLSPCSIIAEITFELLTVCLCSWIYDSKFTFSKVLKQISHHYLMKLRFLSFSQCVLWLM